MGHEVLHHRETMVTAMVMDEEVAAVTGEEGTEEAEVVAAASVLHHLLGTGEEVNGRPAVAILQVEAGMVGTAAVAMEAEAGADDLTRRKSHRDLRTSSKSQKSRPTWSIGLQEPLSWAILLHRGGPTRITPPSDRKSVV